MAEARQEDQWNHTAQLIAIMGQMIVGEDGPTFDGIHPFRTEVLPVLNVAALNEFASAYD